MNFVLGVLKLFKRIHGMSSQNLTIALHTFGSDSPSYSLNISKRVKKDKSNKIKVQSCRSSEKEDKCNWVKKEAVQKKIPKLYEVSSQTIHKFNAKEDIALE